MNTFVLQVSLVCLAIASSVNCKIDSGKSDMNKLQSGSPSNNVAQNQLHTVRVKPSVHDNSEDTSLPESYTFRMKCMKNSHLQSSYYNYQRRLKEYGDCLDSQNITQLTAELRDHISDNDNASLLKSLCRKVPDVRYCARNYITAAETCLDDTEKTLLNMVRNISHTAESFACQDDGARISLFYSEGGVNCIKKKEYAMGQCFKKLADKAGSDVEEYIMHYKFDQEQCNDLRALRHCIVGELKKCDRPTTGNLVDALFEMMLRKTPC